MTFAELVNKEKELLNIPGISLKRAISIRESIEDNTEYLRRITQIIQPKEEVSVKGKKICFTGKMEKPRKYYEQLALEHNYVPSDKVDKTLDLLVTTEMDRQSSKMMAAKKYGIKIIELNQWLEEL
jgi:NAD-dependent DNA ligase